MAEQMTEEQILGAFIKHSPGLSPEETPQEPETAAKDEVTEEAPKAVEAAPQEEEQQAQTIEIDPDEALFEQEIEDGGKKVTQRLSLKELQQGYLRTKDYTQKTQELARQREELPAKLAKQSQELSESYGKRLSELQSLVMKTVAADLQGVDFNKLATEDPFKYVELSNRANQVRELLHAIQEETKGEGSERDAEEQKKKAERWNKSLEVLNRDIPGFGPDVVKGIMQTAQEWGFEQSEVAQWDDARIIKMAHALGEKKAVEAKRPEVEKKVALVTKTLKPGAKTASRSAIDEAKSRLRKSGRPEDALPIFEAFVR